ncbi:MAG: hypothetical protein U0T80_09445 [Flavobacteriaceae bacterium]
MNSIINILTGLLCIVLGIFLIILCSLKRTEKKRNLFSIKFQTAGLIIIIIGVSLIIREIRE